MDIPIKHTFLKWAGNKTKIIPTLFDVFPDGTRIVEPFAGSCAVSLNSNIPSGLATDFNPDLINTFKTLQTNGGIFINYCKTFFTKKNNTETSFYEIRDKFNSIIDSNSEYKAAAFVYLNRHCFNGLCRYNQKGQFNVPFGKYNKPYFPEKEMYYFFERSKYIVFKNCDFQETFLEVKRGDIVYCDPPYLPINKTSFVDYSMKGFGIEQHRQLAMCAEKAINKGAITIISNSDTLTTEKIYSGSIETIKIDVKRFISANGNRNVAKEIIAIYR
jgi:DNA adenine methylase